MFFRPSASLSEAQIDKGLKLVIKDGLAAEAMATLTGGTFLVAIAVYLGASDFQIGLLSALPTMTNIFQLLAIWLVQRYNNRKAIAVIGNTLARFPLLLIGLLPVLFRSGTSLQVLMFLLCFHYFFGSVAGASWNSWMKDLVPEQRLGAYYSHRTRLIQVLSVTLSLSLALVLDQIKVHYPAYEVTAYSAMFLVGGFTGLLGVYLLSRTPEPRSVMNADNLFKLFGKSFKDRNFRRLMVFQSFWTFAINLAIPFFTAYMMKTLRLPLSFIIVFNVLGQLSGILFIKAWGRYADQFSNKTIIGLAAPIYAISLMALAFTATTAPVVMYILLILVSVSSGMAIAGINLAVNNVGIKLAPKDEAIVYMSARNMVVAAFSSMAPLLAGWVGDLFTAHISIWHITLPSMNGRQFYPFMQIGHFRLLFVLASVLALCSLRFLNGVQEAGEVPRRNTVSAIKERFDDRILSGIRIYGFRPVYLPALLSAKGRKRLQRWRRWQR